MPEMWSIELSFDVENLGALGQRLEADGWDGMCLVDSQNMSPEPYVALASIAGATTRLGLGLGVATPVTRHPALAAAAAATIQRISKGRLIVTLGRGDSANAHIGLAPLGVGEFQHYVSALRQFLAGEAVDLSDSAGFAIGNAKPLATLKLGRDVQVSRLQWMRSTDRVGLEIAGTGKRVLDIGARYADRVMLAVGASSDRIAWATKLVREAREAAGLDTEFPIGAYVSAFVNSDPKVARQQIRGTLASTSRFSVMHGSINGPVDPDSAQVLSDIHRTYDMTHHGDADAGHGDVLDDKFVAEFGIAGTAEECAQRFQELSELGIDKFTTFPLGVGVQPELVEEHRSLMASVVLPSLARS